MSRPVHALSGRPNRLPRRLLAALIPLAASAAVQAHTPGDEALPQQPGWRLGLAAAVAAVEADGPVPAAQIDGQTTVGDTPGDVRREALDHATLELAWRPEARLGLHLAVGRHGADPTHIESAWVSLRPAADSGWRLGLGRNRVPLGAVLGGAGHADRFLQTPLVTRAAFHGDWIEEGANLAWRAAPAAGPLGLDGVDFGLWRAERFPGGDGASPAPVLHLQGGPAELRWDVVAAWLRPEARGSFARPAAGLPGVGHSHGLPDCSGSLREVICFDGTVRLLGGSLQWRPAALPGWRFAAAGLHREEDGDLFGRNGDTRYRGRAWGGWLETGWAAQDGWDLALRSEALNARNTVDGPGATLIARDAGLDGESRSWRHALMLGWTPAPGWQLSVEGARESVSGQAQTVLALRLRWTLPELLHSH